MKLKPILIVSYFSLFTFHFSLISAQKGTWFWGSYGIGDGVALSVAADSKGNCYMAGIFQNDTIHFGGYTVMNSTTTNPPYSSDEDDFLVKYAPNGPVLWATQTFEKNNNPNTGGNDAPVSVCPDNFGSVYLSGNFIDTLFIGSYTFITKEIVPYSQNMYLAKYSSNGNLLWAKQAICVNDSSFINQQDISSDNDGNIYVIGGFANTVNIGGQIVITPHSLIENTFLAKYDSSGNVIWARQSTGNTLYGSTSFSNATDIKGNIFITGEFDDTVVFGPYKLSTITPYGNHNCFIAKYDSAGNVIWAKNPIIPSVHSGGTGWALTTDLSGNVYLGGDFIDTMIFAQDTIVSNNNAGFFLVKYAPNGNVLWAKSAKVLDNNDWGIYGLSSDNSKHIYLSANGYGEGPGTDIIAFAGDTLSIKDTAEYDGPSVIFKLDSNGNVICSSIIPVGGGGDNPTSVASDTSGNHVYLGAAASSVDIFGKDTIDPFAYPINHIQHGNYFPFVARWQECDSNIIYAGVQNSKPVDAEVKVYPNPNNGAFTLALQNVNEPAQVEIYNMLGESICKKSLNPTNISINLSGQPAGVYFYRAITNTGSLIGEGKVVIEK